MPWRAGGAGAVQPPHRRSQVKQRSRLARAVFQDGSGAGGLPGQGPPRREPGRNGGHLGRRAGSPGKPGGPAGGTEEPGRLRSLPLLLYPSAAAPLRARAHTASATRTDRLLRPAPQRMGGGLSPGGGVSPSWGQSQPPPFSTGSGPLPWEPRHWQMLLPPSLFHPFVRMRPTCAGRLCVSGAQSLEKVGGACRSFLPVTSVCKVIGPSTRFVWVRGA